MVTKGDRNASLNL